MNLIHVLCRRYTRTFSSNSWFLLHVFRALSSAHIHDFLIFLEYIHTIRTHKCVNVSKQTLNYTIFGVSFKSN